MEHQVGLREAVVQVMDEILVDAPERVPDQRGVVVAVADHDVVRLSAGLMTLSAARSCRRRGGRRTASG